MNRTILRIAIAFSLIIGLSSALISCAEHSKKTAQEDIPQHSGHGCGHQH